MVEHYVTLLDSLFLPQGLALNASLLRHSATYTLWILCVDDYAFEVLERLAPPNIRPLRLSMLETPELLRIKPTRTRSEYCWTLTPFAPRFVFETDATVGRVTYLDADLWFRRNPAPLFEELEGAGASVLITDHAYAPEYDQSSTSGQYCVQFITFVRHGGELVRQWWEDRCIEWCYARFEDGKFGDQKYLDDWPKRFKGLVHVLQKQEHAQAPWNATRYPYSAAIIYHFHGLRILPGRKFDAGPMYYLPRTVVTHVYLPYMADLQASIRTLEASGVDIRPQARSLGVIGTLRRIGSGILNQVWRLHYLNGWKY
jgi:hypothetical protein